MLTSTVPPYTPPGWTSIFTGVNPGKHGIFGFTLGNAQRKEGLVRLDRVQAPAMWNAANAQGARVGLFNIPMTYPPPVVDGWSVSGMLTPEGGGETPQDFTYPESVAPRGSQTPWAITRSTSRSTTTRTGSPPRSPSGCRATSIGSAGR